MSSSNKQHNEKVLKVFSAIRCLNKDQLPRYLEGRLTEVEKHLMEQHLTDCDLCFDALQALEQETNQEKYHDLTDKLQRYIHQSIQPVSHVQKVAQYTRKERTKENLLVYFWLITFVVLGISGIYVLRGHVRNQPVISRPLAVLPPPPADSPVLTTEQQPIVTPDHTPAITTAAPTTTTAVKNAATPAVPKPDSAALKAAAAKAWLHKKAVADSIAKKQAAIQKQQALQKQQDSLRKEAEKNKATPPEEKKPEPKPAPKEQAPPPADSPKKEKEKEPAAPVAANTDEYLYKAAMGYQQQGNLSEAIDRYRRIESAGSGKYVEMARYQLAICYRSKGQMGKARRMFREVIRMEGSLKAAAQQALDSM
ncbi:tetratricopeptide repeat protein [Chitinophaga nivalis]|uniref:Tetratricopeptide repeat protein n=1 Tax=Chitinophaga nivalis TaxID=2991709 RepID=A0ABT3IHI8_9BACT|nr:tetratricopeptide repeat protein [Chitinophaga nivalis]MCW3466885.1 tetratricopeptide repeat protein [Chitinophaga nivalis]MCW3483424.1 tetratricopeptide repeat protein [Chitinophaga nivalis]